MTPNEPVRGVLIPLSDTTDSTGIRVTDILHAARRRWLLLVAMGALFVIGAVAVYATTDTLYRSSTTFVLSSQSPGSSALGALGSQLGSLANLAGISLPNSDGLREEVLATLESRRLIHEFIHDKSLIPVLYADKWDDENGAWDTSSGDAPSLQKAVRYFRETVLEVDREPNSNVVTLSITWTDPDTAAAWANDLVARVDEGLRDRARSEATKSIEFLEQELKTSSNAELQSAAYALIEQNMATIMMVNVRPDFAIRMIDPALAPDPDRPVWPRLSYMLAAAMLVWAVLAGLIVLLFAFRDQPTKPT